MIIRSRIGQTAKVLTPKKVLINTCTIIPIFEHLLCANLKISTTTAGSRVAAVLVAQSCPTLCDPMNWPTRLLHPWDSPSKNTGVDCHALLQGIFLTQESNPCLLRLLHWQVGYLPLSHLGKPYSAHTCLYLQALFLTPRYQPQ